MSITRLLPLCASVVLVACASATPPPASPAPAGSSSAQPQPMGATEAQADTRAHVDLGAELSKVDAALGDLGKRLQVAKASVQAELQDQLVRLQKQDDVLKAQLRATGAQADAEAERVSREIRRAIADLQADINQLQERMAR